MNIGRRLHISNDHSMIHVIIYKNIIISKYYMQPGCIKTDVVKSTTSAPVVIHSNEIVMQTSLQKG